MSGSINDQLMPGAAVARGLGDISSSTQNMASTTIVVGIAAVGGAIGGAIAGRLLFGKPKTGAAVGAIMGGGGLLALLLTTKPPPVGP